MFRSFALQNHQLQFTMKKFIFLFVIGLGFSTLMAQNQFEQRAKNKAEAAAQECLRNLNLSNVTLVSNVSQTQICDYMNPNPQYFGYSVIVYAVPNCPGNQNCIQIAYPVATVQVSCSGQVYDVQCGVVNF